MGRVPADFRIGGGIVTWLCGAHNLSNFGSDDDASCSDDGNGDGDGDGDGVGEV